jgi:hypothetical protein
MAERVGPSAPSTSTNLFQPRNSVNLQRSLVQPASCGRRSKSDPPGAGLGASGRVVTLVPRFLVRRTFQRTPFRPGELVQCDLFEPRELIPVGRGQVRRGWVVTAELCWSRVIARGAGLLEGGARHPVGTGPLPWSDRRAAGEAGADPSMTMCKASELAHLFRALKAPAAARALPRLAERAREEQWSYERFAESQLPTEVSTRESHGGQGRIKAARFLRSTPKPQTSCSRSSPAATNAPP